MRRVFLRNFLFLEVFFISAKDTTLINDDIKAKEVRVIGADGEQVGILPLDDAKELAYDKGLDLVLISPQADPPVCRVMDYGKYRFEKEKKQKEAKKKPSEPQKTDKEELEEIVEKIKAEASVRTLEAVPTFEIPTGDEEPNESQVAEVVAEAEAINEENTQSAENTTKE